MPKPEWKGDAFQKCGTPTTLHKLVPAPPVAGYRTIVVMVLADSTKKNEEGHNVCVPNIALPFRIMVDARYDGGVPIPLDSARSVPWISNVTTPHFEYFYVPRTSQRSPRTWFIIVTATVARVEKNLEEARTFIRCSIFIDGKSQSRRALRVQGPSTTTTCELQGRVTQG
jgi:hypothetical protein